MHEILHHLRNYSPVSNNQPWLPMVSFRGAAWISNHHPLVRLGSVESDASNHRHRLWVHLVGKGFDLLEWDAAPQAAFKQGARGPGPWIGRKRFVVGWSGFRKFGLLVCWFFGVLAWGGGGRSEVFFCFFLLWGGGVMLLVFACVGGEE